MSAPIEDKAQPVVVQPAANSRLDALAAMYRTAKEEADIAAERLKTVTDSIKAELAAAAPGALKVDLVSPSLPEPLRLQAKTGWRLDTKKLKAEEPQTYVRFAVQSTTWELRAIPNGGTSS